MDHPLSHTEFPEDIELTSAEQELAEDSDALFEHYLLTAAANQRPMRIDKFLANQLPQTSRSRIKHASQAGSITVNGVAVKVSYKLKPHDEIRLMLPYPPPPSLEAEDIPLNIRYEDDHLIILHKEAGMVVHPSFGHHTGTLIHALLWYFEGLPHKTEGPGKLPRPGLVHRIDKDTTGLMVIAKQDYAMAHLSKQFFDHTTGRTYQAIVWGDVEQDEGTIEAHIGRNPKDRKFYYAYPDGREGKHAITHYKVLERFGLVTLVECRLETGRTHQIRVHMKFLGHTLFGDRNYGGDQVLKGNHTKKLQQMMRNCLELLPRQALHAKTLDLTHPHTGERLRFDSELPEDMQSVLDKLRVWLSAQ
jgi:23S rRNA pseudouridine1911/1915/1917 synthase